MMFDFECKVCPVVVSVKGRIGKVPSYPTHCRHRMRRLYTTPRFHIQYSVADYANRAYAGDESVPGMSHQEVRATVDTMKVKG
jgi:hypothetical protein